MSNMSASRKCWRCYRNCRNRTKQLMAVVENMMKLTQMLFGEMAKFWLH
jgi:hypothetical protein